jgi:hypothetical protein
MASLTTISNQFLAIQSKPMDISFSRYCTLVQRRIEQHYHIAVVTRDIPDPLTGDLNGIEIHIDYAVTSEQRLFLLAHLFGHTVQWNLNPGGFALGQQYRPPVDESLFPQISAYETEAARYGLALLHETGVHDVDPWFSAYTASDQGYLLHYYRTGEKKDFMSFWNDQSPVLTPEPIPPFTPTRRTFRMDGVVI